MSVIFLGKKDDRSCEEALDFVKSNFVDVHVRMGDWSTPFDRELIYLDCDYVISYLSRWVVPADILNKTKKAAINFHPASPAYPGIGCNNFALYNDEEEYGVTCHFMAPKVDIGAIIATKRFPIFKSDDVSSLLTRTYSIQLALFYEVVGRIIKGETLHPSGEQWTRKPYTRKEFNDLGRITPEMSKEEINRRIRATKFQQWGPTVELGGATFKLT